MSTVFSEGPRHRRRRRRRGAFPEGWGSRFSPRGRGEGGAQGGIQGKGGEERGGGSHERWCLEALAELRVGVYDHRGGGVFRGVVSGADGADVRQGWTRNTSVAVHGTRRARGEASARRRRNSSNAPGQQEICAFVRSIVRSSVDAGRELFVLSSFREENYFRNNTFFRCAASLRRHLHWRADVHLHAVEGDAQQRFPAKDGGEPSSRGASADFAVFSASAFASPRNCRRRRGGGETHRRRRRRRRGNRIFPLGAQNPPSLTSPFATFSSSSSSPTTIAGLRRTFARRSSEYLSRSGHAFVRPLKLAGAS